LKLFVIIATDLMIVLEALKNCVMFVLASSNRKGTLILIGLIGLAEFILFINKEILFSNNFVK